MNALSIPALTMAAVSIYVGSYHTLIYLRRPADQNDLTFALTCLAVGVYDILCAGLYSVTTPQEGVLWQRYQLMTIDLISITLLWFLISYTAHQARIIDYTFTIMLGIASLLALFDRSSLTWLDQPLTKTFQLPYSQIDITYYEMAPGLFTNFQALILALVYLYFLWISALFFRTGDRKKAIPLLMGILVFIVSVVSDTLVSMGVYNFLYLIEYGYFAMILAMAYALSSEIVSAGIVKASLQNSELKYRQIFDNIQDVYYETNLEGIITEISPSIEAISNYRRKELLGKHLDELYVDPLERRRFTHNLLRDHRVSDYGVNLTDKHGAQHFCSVTAKLIADAEGNLTKIVGSMRDITTRQQAEQSLQQSEVRYRKLIQNQPSAFVYSEIILDDEGQPYDYRILDCNSILEKITGFKAADLVGKTYRQMMPNVAPRWLEAFGKVAATGASAVYEDFSDALNKHFRVTAYSPEPGKFAAILDDITDRKRAEDELLKTERLESLGVLAGGIAHDLNNFLTGIVGNIELAMMDTDPAEQQNRLERAGQEAMKVKNLTQQLLTFSKGGTPVSEVCDLRELLTETVNFTLSGSNARCEYALPAVAYPVKIDKGQIRQVINNLIINAQEAMPDGGVIRVSEEKVELYGEHDIPLDDGVYVCISVEDEGVGIPEADRKNVFDPFFTTKPTGNGIGLATAYSIIKQHEGLLLLESEEGAGTRFDIYLPLSIEEIPEQRVAEERLSATGERRILLMDDQESIRDMVGRSLGELGYEVVTCAEGTEVIAEYRKAMQAGNPFSAAILDLTIPGGMGGKEAIGQLRELDPDVIAIVASGYSNDAIITNYREYGFKGAIEKPFRIDRLSILLHEVLTNNQSSSD